MKIRDVAAFVRGRYVDRRYPFRDRLYFLFGTAGLASAGAAFGAAIYSGLPRVAAVASLISFFVMFILMLVSFMMKNIAANRVICSIFLNFFMFPVLFWVTGGVNCGMIFYFILGLSVAALILDGVCRIAVLILSLLFYVVNLYMGFRFPQIAYQLSFEERWMDTVASFVIVSIFIVSVILIMSMEYQREHDQVVENAERLNQEAITDSLTKLYNHRFLTHTLRHIIETHKAGPACVSIILLDIDDFKKVNDTYGHLRGNQVLCRLARLLQEKAGDHYMAARYGGEEFMLVLPGAKREAAMEFAEMIRLDVYHDKLLSELSGKQFSVSGGVAQYEEGMDADEWVRRVDANLYAAKNSGKNRMIG